MTPAWWLAGGSERCDHCLQLYAFEMEYRCVACDGAVCPACVLVVRETSAVLCPPCGDEERQAPGAAGRARKGAGTSSSERRY